MFFGTTCVVHLDACQSAAIEEREVSLRTRNLLFKSAPIMGGLTWMMQVKG